jgi:hypothetical protein
VGGLVLRGGAGLAVGTAVGWLLAGLLAALRGLSEDPEQGLLVMSGFRRVIRPEAAMDWVQLGGILVFGLIAGLFAAALAAARHGMGLTDENGVEEEGR